MGPQHVLAELFRPPRINAASAQRTPVEKFSSELRRQLDDASTSSSIDRESSTRQTDKKAAEKLRDKDREKSSDDSADASATPDTTVSQANAVIDGQTSEDVIAREAAEGDAADGSTTVAGVTGNSSAASAAATQSTAATDSSSTSQSTDGAPATTLQASIQNKTNASEAAQQNSATDIIQQTTSAISSESEQIVRSMPAETLIHSKNNAKENAGAVANAVKVSKQSAIEGDDAKAGLQGQVTSSRQSAGEIQKAQDTSGEPSIQQRKAAISVEQTNGNGVKGNKAGKNKSDGKNISTVANGRANLNGAASAGRDVSRIQVKNGEGDNSAATIARFLVNGAGDDTATSSNSQSGSHVSAATSPLSSLTANQTKAGTATSFSATVDNLIQSRADNSDQMAKAVQVMQANKADGRFNVTMRLDPPELGQMKLNIQMRDSNMTLQVDAQSRDVAKLVESRMSELKDALALHGINVDRAEVVVKSPDTGATSHQQQQDQPHARHNDERSYDGHQSSQGFDESSQQSWTEDRPSWSQHSHDDFAFGEDNEFQKPEFGEQTVSTATSIAERSVNLIA